jgi:hypothetical protein
MKHIIHKLHRCIEYDLASPACRDAKVVWTDTNGETSYDFPKIEGAARAADIDPCELRAFAWNEITDTCTAEEVIDAYRDFTAEPEPDWIVDDSSVMDVIDSAQQVWHEAHPECEALTDEDTDEQINLALGLPATGAIRPLADEFADWSEQEVRQAVAAGMDNWKESL